jgi:hypothetical protein
VNGAARLTTAQLGGDGACRQLLSRQWWALCDDYELFVSEAILRECRAADSDAVTRRMNTLAEIPLLSLTEQAADIARLLLVEGILPTRAADDALHIAIASAHKVDFLLSWNFKPIANPVIQAQIAVKLSQLGLSLPFICAPEDLTGENYE